MWRLGSRGTSIFIWLTHQGRPKNPPIVRYIGAPRYSAGGKKRCQGFYGVLLNADKGSAWKVDYHMVSLCDEALRLLATDAA